MDEKRFAPSLHVRERLLLKPSSNHANLAGLHLIDRFAKLRDKRLQKLDGRSWRFENDHGDTAADHVLLRGNVAIHRKYEIKPLGLSSR